MEQKKFKRKHFFINKDLQVKYMITLLIPMIIMLLLLSGLMFYIQRTVSSEITENISNDIQKTVEYGQKDIERNIFEMSPGPEFKEEIYLRGYREIVTAITEKASGYKKNGAGIGNMMFSSMIKILILGLLIIIGEIAYLSIFVSHKFVGPLFRFAKFSDSINSGNLRDIIYLRKGDELKELSTKFNTMTNTLTDKISELKQEVDRLESSGTDVSALKEKLDFFKTENQE